MLIVLTEQKRTGSTDFDERLVAVDPETIHRMVPIDGETGESRTVKATCQDGEEITLVGEICKLVDQINGPPRQPRVTGYERLG